MSDDLSSTQKLLLKASEPVFRGRLYFFILIIGCVGIFYFSLTGETAFEADDKQKHFIGGQLISTLMLTIGYLVIAMIMLLRPTPFLMPRLFWLPTWFCAMASVGMIVVMIAGVSKEAIDSTGVGNVEWADITATLEGGYAPNYVALIVMMALSPMLVPLDILMQIPQKWKQEDMNNTDVNNYLAENKKQNKKDKDVLLLEDDIASAALVMKFFRKLKFSCTHVETLSAAQNAFLEQKEPYKVLILDCFVRIESVDDRRTGADWMEELNETYPKGQRDFLLIIITGHPEQLESRASMADLVLKKPWEPTELIQFLKEHSVLP